MLGGAKVKKNKIIKKSKITKKNSNPVLPEETPSDVKTTDAVINIMADVKPTDNNTNVIPTGESNSNYSNMSKEVENNVKQEIMEEIKDITELKDKKENFDDTTYKLPIIKLPDFNPTIFNNKALPEYSIHNDLPKFSYGFQHFIHATKNKMLILEQFKTKKKVYLVFNKFERYVDNYENNIGNVSKKYFNLGNNTPDILSRGFYKLWELLFMFDLIDTKKENFVSSHLAEGPGSFIQATMFFRDLYALKNKNDKYYAITLDPSYNDSTHIPPLEQKFINYYDKENPKRFFLHKTFPTKIAANDNNKDDGNLINPKTIHLFSKQMNEKADFITADGGLNWKNENLQEQEAYKLIYAEIFTALKIQKKNGNFVCKLFETFTSVSLKFIAIVKKFYKKVYLAKPLTSRISNSEKYMVCLDFIYQSNDTEYIKMMEQLNIIMEESYKNNKLNLISIFPNYEPEKQFVDAMIDLNIEISNNQFKNLNEMIIFINSNNYNGDIYQMKREMQIFATKYWIKNFLPDPKKFNEHVSNIRNLYK